MNLTFINEYVSDVQDQVHNSLDELYIKQQDIMEFSEETDLLDMYKCFQEGYAKPGSSKELDLFKFDNKHIIKAIHHFNKAYSTVIADYGMFERIKKEQESGSLSAKTTFYPDGDYPKEMLTKATNEFKTPGGEFDKGFQELSQQFDCKFRVYISQKTGIGTILTTMQNNIGKLTVSQSKGFQLGGYVITININVNQLFGLVPANSAIFGQAFVAIMLHEIYHNIIRMMDARNAHLHRDIVDTVTSINQEDDFNKSKSKFVSFVNRFIDKFNLQKSDIKESRLYRRLYVLSKIKDNPGAVKEFEKDIKNNTDKTNETDDLDAYITTMMAIKKIVFLNRVRRVVVTACTIIAAGLGVAFGSGIVFSSSVVALAYMGIAMLRKKMLSLFGLTEGRQEEYFCDLFASMYKLPIHLSSFNRQIKLNKANKDKITELRKIDQSISKNVKDPHPITFDRELTSYKIAKQILESGQKLKKEEREYLQYIVNLHDGIEDIDNPYSKRHAKKLDPKAAEDLQKTLRDFVEKTGVAVTESFSFGGGYNGSGYQWYLS